MHSAVQSSEPAASSSGNSLPPAEKSVPGTSSQGTRFVINLTSSTTPVALKQPSHPGLKRFTFFVSRRLEEGRERFRMHMGYFDSQEEAEKLLDIVREIYPAAWAGVAPGMRLRAGNTPPITGPRETLTPAPQSASVAPEPKAAAAVVESTPAPAAVAVPPAAPVPAAAPLTLSADAPRGAPAFIAPPPATAPTLPSFELSVDLQLEEPPPPVDEAAGALDNMRQVLSSLDDTATRTPVLKPLPELKPARSLDDVQVLKVLEPTGNHAAANTGAQPALAAEAPAVVPAPAHAPVPAKTESDDATVIAPAALMAPPAAPVRKPAPPAAPVTAPTSTAPGAPRREVAAYAVQLMWSVQPIRVDQVPQLAIFSAYTLYAAEGNRDGRRWYGLRLGFFTDPLSARQVAQYVRSEFSSVSVVPVTARERDRAGAAPVHPTLTAAKAESAVLANGAGQDAVKKDEFKLLEDSGRQKLPPAVAAKVDPRTAALARIARALPPGTPSTGGKRAKLRPQPAADASASAAAAKGKPRRAMTLEETLEVLGADKLEMTQEGGEMLSDSGVRHLSAQAMKSKRAGSNSRIGRLFERLSERMGGS